MDVQDPVGQALTVFAQVGVVAGEGAAAGGAGGDDGLRTALGKGRQVGLRQLGEQGAVARGQRRHAAAALGARQEQAVAEAGEQPYQGLAHLRIQVGDGAAGKQADGRSARCGRAVFGYPGEQVLCRDRRQGASLERGRGKAQAQAARARDVLEHKRGQQPRTPDQAPQQRFRAGERRHPATHGREPLLVGDPPAQGGDDTVGLHPVGALDHAGAAQQAEAQLLGEPGLQADLPGQH